MNTHYILKKELPDSKPGDIYIWNKSSEAYYKNGNVQDSYWMPEFVQDNPEWFEVFEEPVKPVIQLFDCGEVEPGVGKYEFTIRHSPIFINLSTKYAIEDFISKALYDQNKKSNQ
jgi:hypothetical protein